MPPKKKKNKKKKGKGGGEGAGAGSSKVDQKNIVAAADGAVDIQDVALQVSDMTVSKEGGKSGAVEGAKENTLEVKIDYVKYTHEAQMTELIAMIEKDLSEPYSIFTYRCATSQMMWCVRNVHISGILSTTGRICACWP